MHAPDGQQKEGPGAADLKRNGVAWDVGGARKRAHFVAGCRPDADPLAWIVSEPPPAPFGPRSGALLHDRQIRSQRFDARPLGSQPSAATVPTYQTHQELDFSITLQRLPAG